mmetsp:Transcript_11920/g.17860  ORF Transcript_11920/g.17860 Transcript_11920/m.17860 type:complete len:444 (-) Transcript_11920:82-1413(-)
MRNHHSHHQQHVLASRVFVIISLVVIGLVAVIQHQRVSQKGLRRTEKLEMELYRLRQRQRIVDRELLALGVMLSRNNETWREFAMNALREEKTSHHVRVKESLLTRNVPLVKKKEEDETSLRLTSSKKTIYPVKNSAIEKSSPWGVGPPPDSYFLEASACAKPDFPNTFHVYERATEKACERAAISWRFEPDCPGADGRATTNKRLRRQVLITGVQRSGSHFTWEMFNRLGVHIHHEGLGPAGSASWLYSWRAKSFVINNPSPLTPDHRFCIILHQVRHPLRVLASIVKATKPSDKFWNWIYTMDSSIDKSAVPVLRAAQLWLSQNLHIEKFADARYRAEETSPRDVCKAAGFPDFLCLSDGRYHTTTSKVIQPIIEPKRLPLAPDGGPPIVSDYRAPSVTWDHLRKLNPGLTDRIQDLAKRYGYHLDPRYHPQGLATSAFKA